MDETMTITKDIKTQHGETRKITNDVLMARVRDFLRKFRRRTAQMKGKAQIRRCYRPYKISYRSKS